MSQYLTENLGTSDLLPCANCGGEAEWRDGSSTKPYIRCKKCGMRTWGSYNYNGLRRAWNRRPSETAEMYTTMDEDGVVGRSVCGGCGRTVGPQFRYCQWCGRRLVKGNVE
jgi:DNA-directed RNA polymerase subunit RPC12/RpoP